MQVNGTTTIFTNEEVYTLQRLLRYIGEDYWQYTQDYLMSYLPGGQRKMSNKLLFDVAPRVFTEYNKDIFYDSEAVHLACQMWTAALTISEDLTDDGMFIDEFDNTPMLEFLNEYCRRHYHKRGEL